MTVVSIPIILLTRPEVEQRVKLGTSTLYRWMREGKFPRPRRLGGAVRWLESDIDQWIAALSQEAA